MKEYLNDLKIYLSARKSTVNENIQKVINKNYILTKDDLKLNLKNYCLDAYYLIRAMHREKNSVRSYLPCYMAQVINGFAYNYDLFKAKNQFPSIPEETNKNIR